MKKRLFAVFVSLCMIVSMLPAAALADAVVVVPPGGGDGGGSVVVTPDEPGNVTVIVPGEDGGDVVVVIPPDEEEEPEPPAIGDVVNFAGHEWYIIGTDDAADGGVTAPAGCYTLFAKNNDFGSTAFRTEENGGDRGNSTAYNYKDSDLYNRMNEIANGFSEAEKANIVSRAELDNIQGDPVEDQFLWPIGRNEASSLETTIRQFETEYWGRTGECTKSGQNEPFDKPVGEEVIEYFYTVFAYNPDGSERWEATSGVLGTRVSTATNEFAVRPALYVKAEAFTGGAEASPVIGNTVSFAGHEWYIIGSGLGGVTAPAGCYTLFAKNNDFGSTAFGNVYYKDSTLCQEIGKIANSFADKDKTNIVARDTLDGISGESPTSQYLWPLSVDELNSLNDTIKNFSSIDYCTRYAHYDDFHQTDLVFYYQHSSNSVTEWTADQSYAVRPALYVKAEAVGAPKVTESLTGGKVYFGNQDWYIVGMGDTGPVPGPSNTVTLFADSIVKGQYAPTSINYSQGGLCAAMKNLGASLNLSDQAQSLISRRTLTTEDEITGDAVTTPFWPLSKSEFEAIQAENQSLLMGDAYPYWLRTEAPSELEIHRTVYAGDTDGSLTQNSTPDSNFGVRPAFYLDLSTLFFAAGESSMGNSVNGNPVKLMPPRANSSQSRWNFVMYDSENLSLSMSAELGQSGQSLTFQYNGTGGPYHSLAYVLEQDGVPVYYGNAASLKDSGSGTATVPLLGSSSKLEDGDYTMRFYEEDRTDGIYFASDTVDLTISVANGAVSVTNMGDIAVHTHSFGTGWESDESGHWHECSCGEKVDIAAHSYDNDQDAECNVCTFKRVISHVHQGVLVPGTPATCTTDGVKDYYECSVCHQYFEDADCTKLIADLDSWKVIPETGHAWTSTYLAANADESKHYHVCTVCGAKDEGEAHIWNTESATEQNDKHCTICNYVAEEQLEHTHTYGTEWKSDADTHWHECSCGEKTDIAAHSYDNDQDAECNICGYERQITPPVSQEYTVTFNANGGSVTPSSVTTKDGKLTSLPIPTYDGYTFLGWYTEETGGEKVTTDTVFAENTTIYAHWQKQAAQEYTVTLNANGGTINSGVITSYTYGVGATLPTDVTREGYTFAGWYEKEDFTGDPVAAIGKDAMGDKTYWAKWEEVENPEPEPTPTPTPDPEPSGPSTGDSTGWDDILDELENTAKGDQITIDMGDETKVPAEIFESLAGKDVEISFDLGDIQWSVNGADIPTDTDFTDLDLGASLGTSGIPVNVINTITGERDTVQMTLAHDGEFGFTMTLTAPLGKENAGYWANLYHYDEDAEALNFEAAAKIDEDGSVTIPFSHASQYAIVIDTHSHAAVDVSDLFIDIAPDAWYKDAIQYAYDNGLMTGVSDTEFAPEATTTRAMIVSILARLEGVESAEAAGFADVDDNDWYATAVNWAANVGVVNGYEDNTFQPNTAITREQLAAILMNYAAYKGEDVSNRADLTSYTDQPSTWAQEAMQWAVAEKLITGVTNDELQPQSSATRAQVAAILQRYLEA